MTDCAWRTVTPPFNMMPWEYYLKKPSPILARSSLVI